MDRFNGMTTEDAEKMRELMKQMRSDKVPDNEDTQRAASTQQTIQSQPVQQSHKSQQEQLRERMMSARANATDSTQQVVLQQTESYQPSSTAQPVQQTQQTQTVQGTANDTIINTTQTGGSGGFQLSKPLVFGIAAIVVAVLVVGYILLKPSGDSSTDVDTSTEGLEWLDPVGEETFLYTPDEITQLRAAGYTGDEIESYQTQQVPAADLITQAEAERDAWIQEAIAPLYDTASDEYKHYVAQTWLTLPERTDMTDWTMIGASYTETKNLDYEKIDVYGNQLFIKVYLDDNEHADWFFVSVTPDEWNQLNDSGNVLVTYTYWTHLIGDDYFESTEDMDDIYIVSASLEII
jgi:hypothetical protein